MSDVPPGGGHGFMAAPQNNSLFASNAMDGFGGGGASTMSQFSDIYSGPTGDQTSDLPSDSDISQGSFMMNSEISEQEKQDIIKHIDELKYAEKRDNALLELSRQREHFSELAPFIWHSVGTIAALLQEIVSVYPLLSPPLLDSKTSNKACNVLALLQCVASHKDTRPLFLKAHITLFLYPFLNTVSKGRSFEYLRLTSLGVVGALVKVDHSEVISFLLQTEIIPLCLRIMERGTDLSQTVATFIIQKILMDNSGLTYLCMTAERFFAVSTVLNNMVDSQLVKPSTRLLKHIIKCYFRLSENPRAQMALNTTMPTIVKEMLNENQKLTDHLDESSKKLLSSLIETLQQSNQRNGAGATMGASGDELPGSSQDSSENQNNMQDLVPDFNLSKNLGQDQFADQNQQQVPQHQFQRQHSQQPVGQPQQQQQQQQPSQMNLRPLSSNHSSGPGFVHPANGQVMQNMLMTQGGNPNQTRQMSSTSMPFAAAQAMRQPQVNQGNMRNMQEQQIKQQPFGGQNSNGQQQQAQQQQQQNANYMFQSRGGVVTSPRLTGQPGNPNQQLNYLPQPGGQNQSRTSPPPSHNQPAFMHQFQGQMQPGAQFSQMMQPQFSYSLQQQARQQQPGQTQQSPPQQPQYAQRQTSPNMPPQGPSSGANGFGGQGNFHF